MNRFLILFILLSPSLALAQLYGGQQPYQPRQIYVVPPPPPPPNPYGQNSSSEPYFMKYANDHPPQQMCMINGQYLRCN